MKKHLIVVYLDVTSASAAKAWLRDEILPHVTTADNMHAFRDRFKEARKEEKDGTKPALSNSATLNIANRCDASHDVLDNEEFRLFIVQCRSSLIGAPQLQDSPLRGSAAAPT